MRHCLIIANRTLGGQQLLEEVHDRVTAGPWTFRVIVPVVDAADRVPAQARLDAELARLSEVGATVEGALTDGDPYEAVLALTADERVDEVLVCTLPPGISRWLGLDLPGRLQRVLDVPVTHIVAPAGLPARVRTRGERLTIYLGESDQSGSGPLYSEIVRRARRVGLAGATALRGVEGFGASSVIHTSRLLTLSEDLPMIVTIVDTTERIEQFLPWLDDLLTEGLVVREPVEIVKYAGRQPPADA